MALGAIIGVGWIILVGRWLNDAGPLLSALVFFGAGLCLLAVGWCYAELCSRYAVTGGEYVYAVAFFGEGVGFIVGWCLALSLISVVAFEVLAVSWVLDLLFPSLLISKPVQVGGVDFHLYTVLIGVIVMALIALANYRGGKAVIQIQNGMTLVLALVFVVFVGSAFIWGTYDNYTSYSDISGFQGGGAFRSGVAVLATAPFLLTGFNMIPQAMGEVGSFRPGQIHKVIALAIGLSIIFYILIILSVSFALPKDDLSFSSLPAAYAFERLLGHAIGGKIILISGLLGLLTTWNAVFFAASRLLYKLGESRMLPDVFCAVSSRGTPGFCALFVSVSGLVLVMFGRVFIDYLINVVAVIQTGVMMMVCYLACRIIFQEGKAGNRRLQMIIPVVGLATMILMMFAPIYQIIETADRAIPVEMQIGIVWLVLGYVFWQWNRVRLKRQASLGANDFKPLP